MEHYDGDDGDSELGFIMMTSLLLFLVDFLIDLKVIEKMKWKYNNNHNHDIQSYHRQHS